MRESKLEKYMRAKLFATWARGFMWGFCVGEATRAMVGVDSPAARAYHVVMALALMALWLVFDYKASRLAR